jgi:arabinofuranosyltransferase
VLTIIVVVNAAGYYARIYHYNVIDDAYISFQYAKNWVLGNGLVFNVGERVEGYTNFLWVVVLAPLYAATSALGVDFTRAAIILNMLIACIDLVLVFAVCRRLPGASWLAVSVALVLCALDNAYQGYALSGLEIHLVILLTLTSVLIWQVKPRRWPLWLGLALALGVMTRPDAALFPAAFALAVGAGALLPARFREERPRRWWVTRLALALGAAAVLYGAYFAWRYSYYGALLPNTFYVKVTENLNAVARGWIYANGFFVDRYYLPLAALFAARWVAAPVVRWLLLYLVLHTAYVVVVGGDFYSGHRFFVVLLPVYYLLIGLTAGRMVEAVARTSTWRWIAQQGPLGAAFVAVCAGTAAAGLVHFTARGLERGPYRQEYLVWGATVDNNVRYMKWLKQVAPRGARMVVGDIGSAGFIADLEVVDVHGIVDPVIARQAVPNFGRGKPGHEKHGSRDYLLSKDPTYIKWGWIHGDLHGRGYYVFTDFPDSLDVPGLWVRDERDRAGYLRGTRFRFTSRELQRWTATGTAFRRVPTMGSPRGQRSVFGQSGPYVNSYASGHGDAATGTLLSPEFRLRGDLLQLRIGGGRDRDRLRISLLVDGERIHWATGSNSEVLGRREWPISSYRGRSARLEIVDHARGSWGHIMVDEVVQWSDPAGQPSRRPAAELSAPPSR